MSESRSISSDARFKRNFTSLNKERNGINIRSKEMFSFVQSKNITSSDPFSVPIGKSGESATDIPEKNFEESQVKNESDTVTEPRNIQHILPYDNALYNAQYFYNYRDEHSNHLNESTGSLDLSSYHVTMDSDTVQMHIQNFKNDIAPHVPLYRNINSYTMHSLDTNQKEFLIDYYYYLSQSGPWTQEGERSFEENVFPPVATEDIERMKKQILNGAFKSTINPQKYNSQTQCQPMKNDADDDVNQNLLLSFLEERLKRLDTETDFSSSDGLAQTSTFIKKFYAPTEEVLRKKKRENEKRENEKREQEQRKVERRNHDDLKSTKSSDSKIRKDSVEKRPRTSDNSRILKLSLQHASNRVERASTAAGRKAKHLNLSKAEPPTSNLEATSIQDEVPIAFNEYRKQRRNTVSLSFIEGKGVRHGTPIKQKSTTKKSISDTSSCSSADTSSEITLESINEISSSFIVEDRHVLSRSEEDSSTDASMNEPEPRSKLPLTDAELGNIKQQNLTENSVKQEKQKSKKKKEKKTGQKSSKKPSETSSTTKVKSGSKKKRKETSDSKNRDRHDISDKNEKAEKSERKSRKSKNAQIMPLVTTPEKGSKFSNSLSIDSIVLPIRPKFVDSPSVLNDSNIIETEVAELEKQAKLDNLFGKVNRLIDEISLHRPSNKKALIDLLQIIELRQNQSKLIRMDNLLIFLKEKLTCTDCVMQLFAARCVLKLSFSKANRELLFKYDFLSSLLKVLTESVNATCEVDHGKANSSSFVKKADNKLLREILKSIHLFCKLGEMCVYVIEDFHLVESIVRLIKYEELKSQKIALRCLCSIIQMKAIESQHPLLTQICKLGAIDPLFTLLKNATSNIQRDALHVLCYLSANEFAREEIYNKGVFHSFLWLMRSESEEIQELAITALSRFVPNEILHVDALILKYGLDYLIQFFVESFNNNIVSGTTKILAHVSEYSRVHLLLLQPNVLKQAFNLLFEDDAMTLKSTMFGAHVMLSNLSKYKEGQAEIYRHGGIIHILKSVDQIACHFQSRVTPSLNKEDDMSPTERLLLPKVVTRTIANLSGSLECQSKITNESTLERLVGLVEATGERTVIWNVLCCISNLCDQPHNQRKLLSKSCVTDCLLRYLTQKEDEKLLSRSIRCLAILSKNVHIQEELEKIFQLKLIVPICRDIIHSEIQLDALRYITNLSHNYDFHDSIIENGALKIVVKLSYFPLPVFHLEVSRCLYNLSQNTKCRAQLVEEGAVTSLMRLKSESKHEKVRRYCETALKKF